MTGHPGCVYAIWGLQITEIRNPMERLIIRIMEIRGLSVCRARQEEDVVALNQERHILKAYHRRIHRLGIKHVRDKFPVYQIG